VTQAPKNRLYALFFRISDFGKRIFLKKEPRSPPSFSVPVIFRVMGPEAKGAIPDLVRIAHVTSQAMVTNAARGYLSSYESFCSAVDSLSYLGPDAVPGMLQLANQLQGRDTVLEQVILEAMCGLGTNGEAAVPSLVIWSNDTNSEIRLAAVVGLGEIAKDPILAIPALRRELEDTNDWIKVRAALSIGCFGKEANSAIPDLAKMLDDPDLQTREAAILGLGMIGQERGIVVPLLAQQLKDDDPDIRRSAATALGDMGGQTARDALMKAQDDADSFVRNAVVDSLKKIDLQSPGKDATPRH
jgi:hypothetical protein